MKMVDKAWERGKERGAWSWLQGNKALQKSIMVMIRDEEVEMRRLVEEKWRNQRLVRKAELELAWEGKRRRRLDDQALEQMETDPQPPEDILGELMRCLALVEDMEDGSSYWLKWQEDTVMVEAEWIVAA